MSKYQYYEIDDFLKDPAFRQWVHAASPKEEEYWKQLALQYPHLETKMDAAQRMLRALPHPFIPKEEIPEEKMLNTILSRVRMHEASQQARRRLLPWAKIAASVALFVACFVMYTRWETGQWIVSRYHTEKTDYGEIREIVLPDQSRVVLNANATIRYRRDWTQQAIRELWLEGEAYFKVHRQRSAQKDFKKFVVHVGKLDVEVTGTEFNVYQGRTNTEIALAKGEVVVNLLQADQPQEIVMTPGELVTYSAQQTSLTKTQVDPKIYSAWQHQQLVFEGVPLRDVAHRLEEIFGYQVVFLEAGLANKRFQGTVPINDLTVLVQVLEKAYGIDIVQSEQQLLFGKRSP